MLAETGAMLKKICVWTIASTMAHWFFNKILLNVLNNKLANLLEETTSFKG